MKTTLTIITLLLSSVIPKKSEAQMTVVPGNWQIVYEGPYVPQPGVDYTILDLFDYSYTQVAAAPYPIAYFSAHYEDFRRDKKKFGKLLRRIPGYPDERYIDWRDRKNRRVMIKRLRLAKAKGFKGVDLDNVDGPKTLAYFRWLERKARALGLTVGLKNAVEILPSFGTRVDFFVSEAIKLNEMTVYQPYNKPAVRMYYNKGAPTPAFLDQVANRVEGSRF